MLVSTIELYSLSGMYAYMLGGLRCAVTTLQLIPE